MKEKFIIGAERMQLLTNVSIPSRRRYGKTVAQPGSDSEYSPQRRGGRDGRSRDRRFRPFKSFKSFKTIKIGGSDTTPCLCVNTNLLSRFACGRIPSLDLQTVPLRAIALTRLRKTSFRRHLHVCAIAQIRNYQFPLSLQVSAEVKGMHASMEVRRPLWPVLISNISTTEAW
jgi:hypothetical protein